MVNTETMEGVIAALQEDCKDLPPCGHAACIVLHVIGIPADHDFNDDSARFLNWLDFELEKVIEACASPGPDVSLAEAVIKSELAIWFVKGVMMGKKLARVDDETP